MNRWYGARFVLSPRAIAHSNSRFQNPMPTYEYVCSKCGHHFEKFQSMNDGRLKKCPKCGKSGLRRLVGGGAGLIFKGSGFYITDYKKGPAKKEGGDSKPASSETKLAAGEAKPASAAAGAKPAEGASKPAEKNPPKT
jgi:putative FmdB family regulatory protein